MVAGLSLLLGSSAFILFLIFREGASPWVDLLFLVMAASPIAAVRPLRCRRLPWFAFGMLVLALLLGSIAVERAPEGSSMLPDFLAWMFLVVFGAGVGRFFHRLDKEQSLFAAERTEQLDNDWKGRERELEEAMLQARVMNDAARDIANVYDITREIGSSINVETILQHAGAVLKRVVISEQAEILIAPLKEGSLRRLYDLHTGEQKDITESGLPLEHWNWVLQNAQELQTTTSRVDSRFHEIALDETLFYNTVLPLSGEGGVNGALWISTMGFKTSDGMEFNIADEVEMGRLRIVTQQIGLALEKARLYTKVEHMSITDALTGLSNHSHFQRCFEDEWNRTLHEKLSLSVIMIDIDHFKGFNDRYGHSVGDAVLKAVAQRVRAVVRELDLVARYGGEEFVVLSPETDSAGALVVAERIRSGVEANKVETESGELSVTVSVGIASYPEIGAGREDLLAAADAALYEAKRGGRNRVAAGTRTT